MAGRKESKSLARRPLTKKITRVFLPDGFPSVHTAGMARASLRLCDFCLLKLEHIVIVSYNYPQFSLFVKPFGGYLLKIKFMCAY